MENYIITKQIIEIAKEKAIQPFLKKISELKGEASEIVSEIYGAQIPAQVKNLFNKHPNYFNRTYKVGFRCNDLDYKIVSLKGAIPSTCSGTPTIIIESDETSKRLFNIFSNVEKLESDAHALKRSINVVLSQNKSYNKVKSNCPQLIEFLPEIMKNNVPALNYTDLIEKINNSKSL